jgi:hypothetical protein
MSGKAWRHSRRKIGSSLVVVAALAAAPASAQYPVHVWSQGIGGTSGDEGRGVGLDAAGNIYVTGVFGATVDFGGGPIASTGSTDIFLAKYGPDGNHLWSRNFGGTSGDHPTGIFVDGDGTIAIVGRYWVSANFGGPAPLTGNGFADAFVATYDTNGSYLWSRSFGGTSNDEARCVTIDDDGNVIVSGFFAGSADFGGGTLSSAGAAASFLAKYTSTGTYVWSRATTGTGTAVGNGVDTDDDGNVLLVGQFNGSAGFGGGNLLSASQEDLFLAKYDSAGAHQWSKRFGNVQNHVGHAVACDGSGNVIITGHMSGTVDYGGGQLLGYIGANVILAKYDPAGAHLWSQTFGVSQATDIGYGLALDTTDHIHLTGCFESTADFGGGGITSGGARDIFIARFDPAGVHEWSAGYGTTSNQEARSLAVDGSGGVVVTGIFANALDFGEGFLLPAGGNDVFLAKFDGGAATGVEEWGRPSDALSPVAYPNPFRSHTTLDFTLPRRGRVTIGIYDARGAQVATVLDAPRSASRHQEIWTGRDDAGRRVAAGVYFARYLFEGRAVSEKLVRLE